MKTGWVWADGWVSSKIEHRKFRVEEREGDSLLLGGRVKISQASLFTKTVRMVICALRLPCLINALTLTPNKGEQK